jgi:cell wall-associated NlpC family hydrolase
VFAAVIVVLVAGFGPATVTARPAAQAAQPAPAVLSLAAAGVLLAGDTATDPAAANVTSGAQDAAADRRELAAIRRADRATRPAISPVTHPAAHVPSPASTVRAKTSPHPPATAAPVAARPASGAAAAALRYALRQVGKPYVFGAAGPAAFDCSGLVVAAYASVGIGLPHSTGGLLGRGRPVARNALQPGDLVFPSSGHVGIYVGDGMMVHAPHTGTNVKVAPIYAFMTARRIG